MNLLGNEGAFALNVHNRSFALTVTVDGRSATTGKLTPGLNSDDVRAAVGNLPNVGLENVGVMGHSGAFTIVLTGPTRLGSIAITED